ncbi:MAG: multidrug effflux MFS transporter [Acidobacteria bacterium]|nr:multidrug effflux MFS transporter [Acidobacteriota bacterium]
MSTISVSELNHKVQTRSAGLKFGSLAFILAMLSMMGPFSIDTYLPSLPSISRSLGASPSQVQQTVTAFLILFAFMSLWHGAVSDAYGRRRLVIVSLGIFAAASVGCALAGSVEVLLFFRALQGATAGAGMIVGRAVVRDLYEGAEAQKLMSHVATIFTIAPVLAPVVGGWLQVWFGWRAVFVFLLIFALLLMFSSWRALPETLPRGKRQRLEPAFLLRSYGKVLSTGPFVLSSISLGICNAGFFIYIMSAPRFLMTHLGLRETDFLWLFGPIAIGMMMGAHISGRVAGKISGNRTVLAGYCIMAAAAAGNAGLNLLLPPMLPWTIVPLFVFVVGMTTAMPSLTLMGLDLFPLQKGLAASCQGFIMLGLNSLVAALVPLIWGTALSLAVTCLSLTSVGLLMLLLYFGTMKKRVTASV